MRKPVTVMAPSGAACRLHPGQDRRGGRPARDLCLEQSAETELDRVYSLAITYCDDWNAPPRLVADEIDGEQHTSTFACVPRPTLPFGQSPVGRALERF